MVLAAVALLCLSSAIGFGIYRLLPDSPPNQNVPAPVFAIVGSPETAVVDAGECTVTPRTEYQYSLRGTPTIDPLLFATTMTPAPAEVGLLVPAMNPDDLPTGAPASPDVVDGIGATLREQVACLIAGDIARLYALYSDDTIRRQYRQVEGAVVIATPEVEQPVEPFTVPAIIDVRTLPNGRVGVLLNYDILGLGLQEFLIFVHERDRWLVDEQVLVIFADDDGSGTPTPARVIIQVNDSYFEPSYVVVPANTAVTLQLLSAGVVPYSFVIDDLGVEVYLMPGETKTVEINTRPGKYEFISGISGQHAARIFGTLVAVSESTPVSG